MNRGYTEILLRVTSLSRLSRKTWQHCRPLSMLSIGHSPHDDAAQKNTVHTYMCPDSLSPMCHSTALGMSLVVLSSSCRFHPAWRNGASENQSLTWRTEHGTHNLQHTFDILTFNGAATHPEIFSRRLRFCVSINLSTTGVNGDGGEIMFCVLCLDS